jgi:hypothetical protein
MILTLIYMQDKPLFSLFTLNFQGQIMMMIVGLSSPLKSRSDHRMELVNESFVLMTNYHLLLFTDFVLDLDVRDLVGKSLVALTVGNCILSIGLTVVIILQKLCRKLKLFYLALKRSLRIKARTWKTK